MTIVGKHSWFCKVKNKTIATKKKTTKKQKQKQKQKQIKIKEKQSRKEIYCQICL